MSPTNSKAVQTMKILSEQAGLGLKAKELKDLEPMYSAMRKQLDELNKIDLGETGPEVTFSASWVAKEEE